MIPPRLAYQIQNFITRKLLESPQFNRFVANVDGTLHSIRLGLKEGIQEAEKELSSLRKKPHDQATTNPTSSSTSSYSNLRDQPSSQNASPPPPREPSNSQAQARLNTAQKLEDLEKLRRQQPKS